MLPKNISYTTIERLPSPQVLYSAPQLFVSPPKPISIEDILKIFLDPPTQKGAIIPFRDSEVTGALLALTETMASFKRLSAYLSGSSQITLSTFNGEFTLNVVPLQPDRVGSISNFTARVESDYERSSSPVKVKLFQERTAILQDGQLTGFKTNVGLIDSSFIELKVTQDVKLIFKDKAPSLYTLTLDFNGQSLRVPMTHDFQKLPLTSGIITNPYTSELGTHIMEEFFEPFLWKFKEKGLNKLPTTDILDRIQTNSNASTYFIELLKSTSFIHIFPDSFDTSDINQISGFLKSSNISLFEQELRSKLIESFKKEESEKYLANGFHVLIGITMAGPSSFSQDKISEFVKAANILLPVTYIIDNAAEEEVGDSGKAILLKRNQRILRVFEGKEDRNLDKIILNPKEDPFKKLAATYRKAILDAYDTDHRYAENALLMDQATELMHRLYTTQLASNVEELDHRNSHGIKMGFERYDMMRIETTGRGPFVAMKLIELGIPDMHDSIPGLKSLIRDVNRVVGLVNDPYSLAKELNDSKETLEKEIKDLSSVTNQCEDKEAKITELETIKKTLERITLETVISELPDNVILRLPLNAIFITSYESGISIAEAIVDIMKKVHTLMNSAYSRTQDLMRYIHKNQDSWGEEKSKLLVEFIDFELRWMNVSNFWAGASRRYGSKEPALSNESICTIADLSLDSLKTKSTPSSSALDTVMRSTLTYIQNFSTQLPDLFSRLIEAY